MKTFNRYWLTWINSSLPYRIKDLIYIDRLKLILSMIELWYYLGLAPH